MTSIYTQLAEPFPREIERQLRKGGTSLTYIPVSEVITRLNKVLGVDMWSMSIISCERDRIDNDFIVAHVSLSAFIKDSDGTTRAVHRDGIGGQKIKRTKQGDIVDLGDEMKGAVSDALKKAAQTLGVGLYLARTEDALYEEFNQEARETVDPAVAELWDSFMAISKSLSTDSKAELNAFWVQNFPGKPKPTKQTVSISELESLMEKAVVLNLGSKE